MFKSRRFSRPRTFVIAVSLLVSLLGTMLAFAAHNDPAYPNDPAYNLQWGPKQIRAEQAWDLTTGEGVVIGIVDSGVDLDHEDLAAKILPGATFESCPNPDVSCGNGDWESGRTKGTDAVDHGTHVAGISAAMTNNGKGIVGVSPDAKILPVKVTTSVPVIDAPFFEESWKDVARGIRWAADNGAASINLSLGSPIPGNQINEQFVTDVKEAIRYASEEKGVVVVAAAGNSTLPLCSGPPGWSPLALCVLATDKREAPAFYTNLPVKEDFLGVSAPGGNGLLPICNENILSTVPAGTAHAGNTTTCGWPSNRAYAEKAGTSMASPHVAGAAGLLAAMGCTREQNINLLTSTARQPRTNPPVRGTYTPAFGYGIIDVEAAANAALDVCQPPEGSPPIAVDDTAETDEDTPVTIDVLANDTDADGDTLTVGTVTTPLNGAAVKNGDGTVTYSPNRNFHGTDNFSYTVNDGNGGSATGRVTINVASIPDAATAVDDSTITSAGSSVSLNILANDLNPDNAPMSLASYTQPRRGGVECTNSGDCTYTPDEGFAGRDRFAYTIDDGAGGTDDATVTITVVPITCVETVLENTEGDPLLGTSESPFKRGWSREGTAAGDLVWFPHVDPLATSPVHSWFSNGTNPLPKDDRLISPPMSALPSTELSFSHRFYLDDGFDGGVIEISTDDGATWSDLGPHINQGGYNGEIDPLAATALSEKQAWTGSSDANGYPIPPSGMVGVTVDLSSFAGKSVRVAWRHVMDNSVPFPGAGWWVDDIQFSGVLAADCEVPVNRLPLAVNDEASTAEDESVQVDVLANDSDPDGDPISVVDITQPGHGSATLNEDGTISYTPNPNFNGADSLTYVISDGEGASSPAEVSITVTPVNDPPEALEDSGRCRVSGSVSIDVLSNDVDIDGDELRIADVSQPAHGTTQINTNGTISYTPTKGYRGTDSFTYTVSDGAGGTDTASVTIQVSAGR